MYRTCKQPYCGHADCPTDCPNDELAPGDWEARADRRRHYRQAECPHDSGINRASDAGAECAKCGAWLS